MAHASGAALYVEFAGQALQADFRSMAWNESISTYDSTAGADTDESHVGGIKTATITLELLYNGTAGSAVDTALGVGDSGTLSWGPEGTATGKPKYSCVATVTSNNETAPYNDVISYSVEFLKNGTWLSNWKQSGSTW